MAQQFQGKLFVKVCSGQGLELQGQINPQALNDLQNIANTIGSAIDGALDAVGDITRRKSQTIDPTTLFNSARLFDKINSQTPKAIYCTLRLIGNAKSMEGKRTTLINKSPTTTPNPTNRKNKSSSFVSKRYSGSGRPMRGSSIGSARAKSLLLTLELENEKKNDDTNEKKASQVSVSGKGSESFNIFSENAKDDVKQEQDDMTKSSGIGIGQRLVTQKIGKTTTPVWNEELQHFNVFDPFSNVDLEVLSDEDDGTILIGKSQFSLLDGLIDQMKRTKEIEIYKVLEGKSTVTGKITLELQYKYRKTWEVLYKAWVSAQMADYTLAVQLFTQSINTSLHPSVFMVYAYRSEAHLNLKMYDEALADANQCVKLEPYKSEGYYRMGKVYEAQGATQAALKIYKVGLKHSPGDQRLVRDINENEYSETIKLVEDLIKKGKDAFVKARFLDSAKAFQDAFEASGNTIFLVYKSVALLGAEEVEQATETMLKKCSIEPGWPRFGFQMNGMLMKKGKVNMLWKFRYFILKDLYLFYYKRSDDMLPTGVVCLNKFLCKPSGNKKRFQIITKSRIWEFKGTEQKERDQWVTALTNVMGRKLWLPVSVAEEKVEKKTNSSLGQSDKNTSPLLPTKIANTLGNAIKAFQLTMVKVTPSDLRGYLFKMATLKSQWKLRWMVLKLASPPSALGEIQVNGTQTPNPLSLIYYMVSEMGDEIENSFTKGATENSFFPTGSIPLSDISLVLDPPEAAGQAFSFKINSPSNPTREYILSCKTRKEYDLWVKAIRLAAGIQVDEKLEEKSEKRKTTNRGSPGKQEDETTNEEEFVPPEYKQAKPEKFVSSVVQVSLDTEITPPALENVESITSVLADLPSPKRESRRISTIKKTPVTALSDAEARYYSRFGLTPPANANESAHEHTPLVSGVNSINNPDYKESKPNAKVKVKKKRGCCL